MKPTTYAARHTKYLGGPRDGATELEPVACLVEGHNRFAVIGETTYLYVYRQGAFCLERQWRGQRDEDCVGIDFGESP